MTPSELPLHELGELWSGDVGFRVSLANEGREYVAIEIVERDEVGLAETEGFYAFLVTR